MTTAQTDHYNNLSAEYLRKARIHLSEGHLPQATEKGYATSPADRWSRACRRYSALRLLYWSLCASVMLAAWQRLRS